MRRRRRRKQTIKSIEKERTRSKLKTFSAFCLTINRNTVSERRTKDNIKALSYYNIKL